MSIVYLNGEFKPIEEAAVSVLDRGFLFGDGVYEVMPVYGGQLFRLEQHLWRLGNSLDGVRISRPLDNPEWEALLRELVKLNAAVDATVYLQVTRGVGPRDHAFPVTSSATVFAMVSPMPEPAGLHGVKAITARDIRWELCNIKAITLLPNTLLRQQALEAGATEAILHRDGKVTEGAASNVFVVVGGEVATPPKSAQLLPGITRDLVVELLQEASVPCDERPVSLDELRGAQEIWITSSSREIVPVTGLDGMPVSGGRAGPVWEAAHSLYQDFKARIRANGTG
ncbi:MAG: D-amino acid aminotransferase [Gammaproteobacteria bacterium]|nr:D-amino acid aminotransferase [Gammaproteobacteria bacterium]MDJ0891248.1 D-amino acid aminotransferase [Gammaproteobacteria bacterium]